jgi:hypothetical protein
VTRRFYLVLGWTKAPLMSILGRLHFKAHVAFFAWVAMLLLVWTGGSYVSPWL